ncbi:CoA-transferase family III [Crucibulum laeve]|uniref:CoA-transferase family III n=1 Tax=Crucibulum laeve TaxID=68775 RepID=A0A5C3M4S4_9AGAR|nr:CoA-transferase family III [Crucibulum laeve]
MALEGLKVIEFAGLAPGPFAGLILADNGASVTRIDRPSASSSDVLCRGKRSIAINSKVPSGRELLKKIISLADIVIDPFRPGVMERLGLGPEVFLGQGGQKGLNERLIYARIAGFPRTGPHKDMAGHDINYAALSGVLSMLPGVGKPTFPLNLLADFAGGGVMCAVGILLALIERGKSGRGQVVNADMVSGTRYMASFPLLHSLLPNSWVLGGDRGTNALDGGAPFYNVYTCKDGGWMTVGCLEPQFFKAFIEGFMAALPKDFLINSRWRPTPASQFDKDEWADLTEFLTKGFMTNTRDYWAGVFHATEACAVPVLTPREAAASNSLVPPAHPQISGRFGVPSSAETSDDFSLQPGLHTDEVLNELGLSKLEREQLGLDGALGHDAQKSAQVKHKL